MEAKTTFQTQSLFKHGALILHELYAHAHELFKPIARAIKCKQTATSSKHSAQASDDGLRSARQKLAFTL
jgi:hypothetical protein